ncbi:hypothetical protein [Actinomadura chibensis]|uniref:Esterase n=1 Tax=Actinomadura chibensis TaxID=392828 RepID=A0A5D0NUA1_9ACTN|nr:hypothetical protein [Actinomadura chibensis]TYB48086.1 hypothetical protein FXF69_02320 [Actinomadura chibensis]
MSVAFIGPVCLLAAVAVGAALVLWRRAAGPGPRAVLARTGLLLAAQCALTASVVLLANRYFVFYPTWDDLLGNTPEGARVAHVQVQGPRAAPAKRTGTETRSGGGRVDVLDVRGARSGIDDKARVYLPRRYFEPGAETLPVAVVLTDGAAAPPIPADARPTIYVAVRLPGGRCRDVPGRTGGPLAETFLAADLPAALAGAYRVPPTRAGWGVAGAGPAAGRCAARLAMLHSDRFTAAATLDARFDEPRGDPALYGGSEAVRLSDDLPWRLRHVPPPPVWLLAAADQDGPEAAQARRFVSLVRPPMRAETLPLARSRGEFSDVLRRLGDRLRLPPRE